MRLNPDCHLHSIAGEHFIIRPGREETDLTRVISFNATAVWLWQQFADGREFSADDAGAALAGHYDVDTPTAYADAGKWVDCLRQHNLVLP